ncbi:MAG: carboxypeptidase-like regulatory domain-containing protein [Bdellovibrionota bacterium]
MSFRTSIVLYCLSLLILLSIPVRVERGQFYILHQALEMKTLKNSPAYVAFEVSERAFEYKTKVISMDTQVINLNGESLNKSDKIQNLFFKTIRLEAMVFQRPIEEATRFVASATTGSELQPFTPSVPKIKIVGSEISGPIEFSGGLALTPEHHIELSRLDNGIPVENGTVDIRDGSFKINSSEKKGIIVARLIDRSGAELGEGRLSLDSLTNGSNQKLVISPPATFQPQVVSWMQTPTRTSGRAPQSSAETFITKNDIGVGTEEGQLIASNIDAGSSARGIAKMKGHADTIFMAVPGDKSLIAQLPQSTIAALRSIVSEQRNFNLNDPEGPIIWGRVESAGKPLENVQVSLEDDDSVQAVYFNAAMLPQSDLTGTSGNGYFAFVNVPEGFHTVRALRNFGTLSYDNILAERGKVSFSKLNSTLQTHQVPIYVYDAFTGEAKTSDVQLQAFDQPVKVLNGYNQVLLPLLPRQSYAFSTPDSEFLNAQYLYNDNADSIRIPLLRPAALNTWISEAKVEYERTLSTVIGFIPDEDFEIFLTGDHEDGHEALVFFDAEGKVVQDGKRGGGFAIFNLDSGVHELVVRMKSSGKQYMKIFPADTGSITVISFH